jgi:pimeloyl-ACP methyl ester carboxylesterase
VVRAPHYDVYIYDQLGSGQSTRLPDPTGYGLDPRADRNTALLQLTAELPIPVLADLLGLHIGTATRWAEHANAAHTHYAASRASRR